MITCPRCGGQNRPEARFCRFCGLELAPQRLPSQPPPATAAPRPAPPSGGGLGGLLRKVKRWVTGAEAAPPLPARPLAAERPPAPAPAPAPQPARLSRPLQPTHGQATHPGQKRPRNEDAIVTFTYNKEQAEGTVPVGFFLIADGMGGHDAGDVASRTVNQIVTNWIIEAQVLPDLRQGTQEPTGARSPTEMLVRAIQRANEALLRHGHDAGSGLGSTVTAALVIGDVATVANVGDSRTYLLRGGRLEPITQDHSLVARLVVAGVITPAEVRTHPQRSQVYRSLGHRPDVEVDTFQVQLYPGDRLILCSDGLWEMVPDEGLCQIVERSRSPQKACDALVEAANRVGGADNISVIVVEME